MGAVAKEVSRDLLAGRRPCRGRLAVPALRRVLLEGSPSTVYLPRERVARILGELGAFSVLSEYLLREKPISDPELRFAEEAVENTGALELGRSQTDAVFEILLTVAEKRKLPGAIEALARFSRDAAAPVLVAALESDFCRNAAADGIRLICRAVTLPYLIESVRSPEPSRTEESPGSLRRRRAALRLIAEQQVESDIWPSLEFLLHENNEWLQSLAAEIAFRLRSSNAAVRILLNHLISDDWLLVDEISQFLRQNLSKARPLIDEDLASAAGLDANQTRRARSLRWIVRTDGVLKGKS